MSYFVINEELLSQIEMLETLIRNNVAGMFGGNHRSRNFGSSCEFADYRDYTDGDDTGKIDWNAYARFEKLYLKLYLDERQMHTRIYIDASRSMEHGDAAKAEQAIRIAALIAYVSVSEMDKVSVYMIKEGEAIPIISNIVGKESYLASIGALNDIVFDGDSRISDAILQSTVGYGDGMSVIISDFLTDNDYENALNHLAAKRRDIFCVQVLSREELNPLTRGKVHLFDSESEGREYRRHVDREIADAYKRALAYVTENLRDMCLSRGGEYVLVSAEDSISDVFFEKMIAAGVMK